MTRSPDVAVVGGGIVGLAAADALARRGVDVVVLERWTPGSGQSAGAARGFRHLHANEEQIADAVRARAGWDAWSARAGEPLVGEEGALRLGGDVAADAARLGAAGVEAEVVERAGDRLPALRDDAGALLWDRRGGAIRARRTIEWLCAGLGDRVRRTEVLGVNPGRLATTDGPLRCGHVVLCAGAGTERLWPHVTMRRVVHLRVTFAAPPAAGSSWGAATWADRSGRFGALTYGVADGPGRSGSGSPSSTRSRRRIRRPRSSGRASTSNRSARECTRTPGRRSPASARRWPRSSGSSPCCPAPMRTRMSSTTHPT
jgi:sarcosine oxidase